jgi:hypothetical protein
MTFEERMDRISERHESLAHTVGLSVLENQNLSKEIQKFSRQNIRLDKFVEEIAVGIARLLSVVESRERRIVGLEGTL